MLYYIMLLCFISARTRRGLYTIWSQRIILLCFSPSIYGAGYQTNQFLPQKKHGSTRLILNFKQVNECIIYMYFKMESSQDVLDLRNRGCGWPP